MTTAVSSRPACSTGSRFPANRRGTSRGTCEGRVRLPKSGIEWFKKQKQNGEWYGARWEVNCGRVRVNFNLQLQNFNSHDGIEKNISRSGEKNYVPGSFQWCLHNQSLDIWSFDPCWKKGSVLTCKQIPRLSKRRSAYSYEHPYYPYYILLSVGNSDNEILLPGPHSPFCQKLNHPNVWRECYAIFRQPEPIK